MRREENGRNRDVMVIASRKVKMNAIFELHQIFGKSGVIMLHTVKNNMIQ